MNLAVARALLRFCRMVLWLRRRLGRRHPVYQANTERLAGDMERIERRLREAGR